MYMGLAMFIHRRTTGWVLMKLSLNIKPLEAAPISYFSYHYDGFRRPI
jgi:hypothetical protein